MASKKKKGLNKKNDDWDDEAAGKKLAQLKLESASDNEESTDDEDVVPARKGNIAFNMLAALGSDDESSDKESASDSANEKPMEKVAVPTRKEQKKGKEAKKDESSNQVAKETNATVKAKETGKGKAKKGKKSAKEDEDLDALLADLDKPMERPIGKSKKKGAAKEEPTRETNTAAVVEPEITPAFEAGDLDAHQQEDAKAEEEGDAAAKKKDKKKKKKKGGAEKEKSEEPVSSQEVQGELALQEDKGEQPNEEEAMKEEQLDGEAAEGGEESAADKKKEKKKKKEKEKKAKEGDKKETKKKKHVDLIKQLLREKQEAEERLLREQREEEERLAAIQRAKEEEERLAREKKEREKQRKKERDERLKAEGKYLTPAQKEKLRKQQAMLASMNVILPAALREGGQESAPAKRPVYGKKKQRRGQQQENKGSTPDSSAQPSEVPSREISVEPKKPKIEEEKVADSWDDLIVDEKPQEVPDDWEQESEERYEKLENESEKVTAPNEERNATAEVKKTSTDVREVPRVEKEDEAESSSEGESEESSSEEESSEEEEEESSEDEQTTRESKEQLKERVRARLKKRKEAAEAKRTVDDLRAPVICVLGHVDTGKTKMLDTIRRTNVQDGEAGGITQQIGATQVPAAAIKERTKMVREFDGDKMKIPGFLIIDTPGHESFSNLRSRGSSLCDYAILVVDLMHGLEQQTLESLKLLRKRETPFVIALNKIDRLYDYESNPRKDVYQHLKSQPINAQLQFKELKDKVVLQFAEQGVNVALANENPDPNEYVSMVPTSAFLGDGIGNLMAYIVIESQTRLARKLAFCEELECIVMEVKSLPGLGTTIDVILVNGTLRVGDIIVLTGTEGAIMTQIRELLMPQPLRELRVKNAYEHFQSIKAAQGVKILAKGLEKALAGLPIFVANKEDELDVLKEESEAQLSKALMAIKKKPEGVYVQASTLGSLEALLEFLKAQKIPYSNVNIGPVHKKDVQKAAAMLERKEEYACILAFDVRVDRDAEQFAATEGVRIFSADIIYHLEESFLKYREELRLRRRRENEHLAIFPCKLRILPQHVFNARNPIVVGVSVEAGQLKRGTPLCVPSKDCIFIGTVSSIERNHEQVDLAKTGDEVCVKIENTTGEAPKLYGRHFNHEDALVSRISRETIDVCKAHFRDDLSKADWQLIVQLKKLLDIM
uniref:Eukaryotic translation initiation factor 5B n=1 Tax=Ascaris suum TaxID=6253 RepID=F1KRS4_ASCSU